MINGFEIAVMKINLHHLENKETSFKEPVITDPIVDLFLQEFKSQPVHFDKFISLIMMFLNAKVG
jgi:hypothetical protein